MKVYQRMSGLLSAIDNCRMKKNEEWMEKHSESLNELIDKFFPHGSGFDSKMYLHKDSHPEKLIIMADYHHMNEHGFYDGWSELKITVKPSLQFGFTMKITGINKKYSIDREFFLDTFGECLNCECKD